MRKFFIWLLLLLSVIHLPGLEVKAAEAESANGLIQSPSAILMEASTGTVIYEKEAERILSPASITKIMTLLLIFDALEANQISLEDEVVTSAYAKSMGGSQVFLEEGEVQTVETLIKCIAVASGNDASVAMAEFISGSETAFVEKMNQRAAQLGMVNTHFVDCCGLSDSDEHYTTAKDVAVLSRELTLSYPDIFKYTGIWMEDIVHRVGGEETTFTLSSTNKLLKDYPYATGLKTGSTSKAKFCLAATAKKDEVELISVVMAAPDSKTRLEDTKVLLNHGFAKVRFYEDRDLSSYAPVQVKKGVIPELAIVRQGEFRYLDLEGNDLSKIRKEDHLPDSIEAPVEKGQKIGEIVYFAGEKKIGSLPLVAQHGIRKAGFGDTLAVSFGKWLLGKGKI